jgi:hypothetical protein
LIVKAADYHSVLKYEANVIRVIKLRNIRCTGCASLVVKTKKMLIIVQQTTLKEWSHLEGLSVNGRMLTKHVLKKWGERIWIRSPACGSFPVVDYYKDGSDISYSIKDGKFLD